MITGASDGIGKACAEAIAGKGAKLTLSGLPDANLPPGETANSLNYPGDITDSALRSGMVQRTLDKFGRIDVLINNVGVGQYGFPSEVDTEVSKRMFDVNVFAPLALTQLVLKSMRERNSGTIVNIGSVGGVVSLPWAVMYCASKFSLHAIDDGLRRELHHTGISVVKVCPGVVATRFRDHVLAGKAPDTVESIKRVVTPEQVAAGVVSGIESKSKTVFVPKIGYVFTKMERVWPGLMDFYLSRTY